MSNETIVRETKNSIHVDYEGKLSFKDRLMQKLKTSHTWIKVVINIFRFILMLGVNFLFTLIPFKTEQKRIKAKKCRKIAIF